MAEAIGADTLLVTDLTDLRWLTGFDTSHGWAVVRDGEVCVGTDGRYGEKAVAETAGTGASLIVEQDRSDLHDRMMTLLTGTTVLVDASRVPHRLWTDLAARGLGLRHTESVVATLRQVKDAAEIERIEEAARIADARARRGRTDAVRSTERVGRTSRTRSTGWCVTARTTGATRRSSPVVPNTALVHTMVPAVEPSSRATR